MGRKATRTALLICAAIVLAVVSEFVVNYTINREVTSVQEEETAYQLFPTENITYVQCIYRDGYLRVTGDDPQLIWSLPHEDTLDHFVIRFHEALSKRMTIQVYYDLKGEGFSEENSSTVTVASHSTQAILPLGRNQYYQIRIDIDEDVPLEQIDCRSVKVIRTYSPGTFQIAHCVLFAAIWGIVLFLLMQYRQDTRWKGMIRTAGELFASDMVWSLLIALALAGYVSIYRHLAGVLSLKDMIYYFAHPSLIVLVAVFTILYGGIYISKKCEISLSEWAYQYRWGIGFCVLILGVALNVNISSLHEWAGYLGNAKDNGLLLGVSRGIRSDEWARGVGIIKALSYENYPAYSTLIRATSTENVLTTGRIAWDISALYRPFTWGYLLLGSASYGLAFNHCGTIIALFLISFDFFMMLSDNRKLSLAFAFMILFSPFVQWWTSLEIIISSFGMLIFLKKYFTTQSVPKKLGYAALIVMFVGEFALVLYPAWQVPVAYFLLAVLIWILIHHKKDIHLKAKVDIPIIGGAILFLIGSALLIYNQSASAVYDMLHTVYPGTVRDTAPTEIKQLYLNILNLFSPYTQQYIPGPNASEAADFFSFFPLGFLLCLYVMIKNRKGDLFIIFMMILSVFFAAFTFINVPESIRKITFMSFSMSQRTLPWFSFVQLIMLFYGIAKVKDKIKWYIALPVAFVYAGAMTYLLRTSSISGTRMYLVGIFCLLFLLTWMMIRANQSKRSMRRLVSVMMIFSLFSGGMANPIQMGMDEIDHSEIVQTIRSITMEDSSGKWLVEGLWYPYGMLPLMGGAPTINCANNYPNLELWHRFDPDGDDEFAYNRFVSQIVVTLVDDEETSMNVGLSADLMDLRLNPKDLETMEVSYILSNRDLEEYSTENVQISKIASAVIFQIFRVEYHHE